MPNDTVTADVTNIPTATTTNKLLGHFSKHPSLAAMVSKHPSLAAMVNVVPAKPRTVSRLQTVCMIGVLRKQSSIHFLTCGHMVQTRGEHTCTSNCIIGVGAPMIDAAPLQKPFVCPAKSCIAARTKDELLFIRKTKRDPRVQRTTHIFSVDEELDDKERAAREKLRSDRKEKTIAAKNTDYRILTDQEMAILAESKTPRHSVRILGADENEAFMAKHQAELRGVQIKPEVSKLDPDEKVAESESDDEPELAEPEEEKHCSCESSLDDTMLRCVDCSRWFHMSCQGQGSGKTDEANKILWEANDKPYRCTECDPGLAASNQRRQSLRKAKLSKIQKRATIRMKTVKTALGAKRTIFLDEVAEALEQKTSTAAAPGDDEMTIHSAADNMPLYNLPSSSFFSGLPYRPGRKVNASSSNGLAVGAKRQAWKSRR